MMRSDYPKRLVRWGLGALMLLLVHEFCAPRAARAGCNHLVVSQSDRLLDLDRLDAFILGDTSSMVSDDSVQLLLQQQDRTRRLPCSGPSCSDHVPSPVGAASQESGGFDQWGTLNSLVLHEIVSPSDRTIDEPVLRPVGKKPSIFHPPPA
ncbi:MAG: hypothetical protein ACHRXM_03465 [Isosphaerales bacterium]